MMLPSDMAPAWMRCGALAGALLALDIGVPIYLSTHLQPRHDAMMGETMERLLTFVAAVGGQVVWYDPGN